MQAVITSAHIEKKIHIIRNFTVMTDRDLAVLYGVSTKRLNEQISRNKKRFPPDFMFRLNEKESQILRSQFATSSWGGRRYQPYVFTENGIAMLSSVLSSSRAIQVNIQIMRAFTKLKGFLVSYEDLRKKINAMGRKYDRRFANVFDAIERLLDAPQKKVQVKGFSLIKNSRRTF